MSASQRRRRPHRVDKSRRRRRPVIAVFLAVVVVAAGVAVIASALRSHLPGGQPAATATTPVADPIVSGEPLEEEEPSPSPAVTGPRTTFADGIWTVGKDVKPGRYKTTVPNDVFACHWERMRDTNGTTQSTIAEGLGEPSSHVTVTIKSTDKAFKSELCGTWTPA